MSEITQQIKTYCLDLIMAQANAAYDAIPEYFSTLAEQAAAPRDHRLYIDAMHGLGFDRKLIMTAFEQAYDPIFNDLIGAPGTAKERNVGGKDTSSISGLKNIEEKLALETMISKARTRTELPMNSIVRSLNALMGDDWVTHHRNPLDPEFLVKAWLEAIHKLDLPVKSYLALYGLFDVQMLHFLPKIYEKVGHYLEQLPIHKTRKRTEEAKTQIHSTIDDSFSGYENDFGDIDETVSMPYASNSTQDDVNYDEEPQAELHTNELVQLLDTLQRNRDIDDSEYYGVNYLLNYRTLLESVDAISGQKINPWTIGQINDDVVDMTALLFSFIMEDAHLPDDIRFHISRLQIPYLKLGLHDKGIFSNKTHPARQLLNELAESISLWDPTHTGGLDLLLSETISVVDGILNNYKLDPQIFIQYQNSFNEFLSGDAHVDDGMEQRQKYTATKTAKADNARLYIESTLDNICENKRIPPVINLILEEYWSKVLFLEYLKSTGESDDYALFIETTEILVESVQAKRTAEARKGMAKQLPNLIRRLKTGFETISVAAFETIDIFRDLQECHMLVLKERPELEDEEVFEVNEAEFKDFTKDQYSTIEWNREELESALLEESIERSLNNSDVDPYAFEENNNIISSTKNMAHDANLSNVARERDVIDNELKEARDAYEQALKDHQEKNTVKTDTDDSDDFMTQFFQDPDFIQKQYAGTRDISKSEDTHLIQQAEDLAVDEDVFEVLEESSIDTSAEQDDSQWLSDFTKDANNETKNDETKSDEARNKQGKNSQAEKVPSVNSVADTSPRKQETADDLAGRAHGALEAEFNELGDDQVSELIARLKVGLWLDLFHADGSHVRAKIMAIVPTVGKYIFGDRAGRKLVDYNRHNLAEALRTGTIRVTEEDNAFDKTLESVISNLRVLKKVDDE